MKTVLLLAAGASAASDFKLPTITTFFSEEIPDRVSQFIHWYYPGKAWNEWNLEEIMSFLELARSRAAAWGFKPPKGQTPRNPDRIYQDVISYLQQRLKVPDDKVCTVHNDLFSSLAWNDSVVTLNYDLIADHALMGFPDPRGKSRTDRLRNFIGDVAYAGSEPASLIPEEMEEGLYLKLHGSLDWLHCRTKGCRNNARYYKLRQNEAPPTLDGPLPCRLCGAALEVFVVPPVARKPSADRGRLALLWHLALRELASADQVVVIGLSVAPSDFEIRWLLNQASALRSGRQSMVAVKPQPGPPQAATQLPCK